VVAVDWGTRGVTFTGPDGRFELPQPVPQTSQLRIMHLTQGVVEVPVATLPPASPNGRALLAAVTLPNQPLDPVPVDSDPPFRIAARSPDDAELELVDRATRLPSLRGRRPSSGDREIRVYVHGLDGVLILRRRGAQVSGEVWLWWILDAESFNIWDKRLRASAYGCGSVPFHWATVPEGSVRDWRLVLACRPPFSTTPDWAGLWRRLDSLDVWRLADETVRLRDEALVTVMIGSVVSLRLFDGQRYRFARHGDRIYKTTPWGMRAGAIQAGVSDAFSALQYKPSSMERPVHTVGIRGIVQDTAGRPLSGALITVPALPTSARTGNDGRFQLPHPVPYMIWLGVQHPGHQAVAYHTNGLPSASYDSLGFETTITLRSAGSEDGPRSYRGWPKCGGWDAFADRVAGSLVAAPEASLVTDPALCVMAGLAYADAERDPLLSEGRQQVAGDVALGKNVYVFRVNGGYVVFDEYNRVDGLAIGWAFDEMFKRPWNRRRVGP
jgi:hypothetical protein